MSGVLFKKSEGLPPLPEVFFELAERLQSPKGSRYQPDPSPRELKDAEAELADIVGEERAKRYLELLKAKGYLAVGREGELLLGPRGMRALGAKYLEGFFHGRAKSYFYGFHPGEDAPGPEPSGEVRPYRRGEPLFLNAAETLKRALFSGGMSESALVQDLSEVGAAMATALLLDCSHSMVLYEKDRFTPAKRVALALYHLIQKRFPGDRLELICFGDRARRVPPAALPFLSVGPWHTNTAEALALAHRYLKSRPEPKKAVILVTDGKPSAITLPGGELYKNAWNLDEKITAATLKEAARIARLGARLHVYMLADHPELLAFVRRLVAAGRGRAVLADPEEILRDFSRIRG